MSIWEFREARRRLEKQGVKEINEALIFRSYEQMRAIEEQVRNETKHVRRKNQQRRSNKQIYQPKAVVETEAIAFTAALVRMEETSPISPSLKARTLSASGVSVRFDGLLSGSIHSKLGLTIIQTYSQRHAKTYVRKIAENFA